MNQDCFNKIFTERIEKAYATLVAKGKEYAPSQDRLHNFKRAAAITRQTPEQVCVGFMVKHLVSVLDLVDAEAAGTKPSDAAIDEKIGDLFNYIILLEALLRE